MKTSMMMFAAFAAATISTATFADTADAKKLTAGRGKVLSSCKENGGWGWGGAGGGYGCVSKGGYVTCDSNGNCDGGRFNRRGPNTRPAPGLGPVKAR